MKRLAVSRALAAINEHLEEPIESVIARDADGEPCLEAKVPQDVEADLAMPGGHIFHGDLDWPWAPNRSRLETPGQQWGVQTGHDSVLLCGSGARRGGAVSGIGGHNAAITFNGTPRDQSRAARARSTQAPISAATASTSSSVLV